MRRTCLAFVMTGLLVSHGSQNAEAQVRPRRSVTIQFQRPAITKTQFSPDSPVSDSSIEVSANSQPSVSESNPLSGDGSGSAFSPTVSSHAAPAGPAIDNAPRPNVQQMQNPSGAFHMTHGGITHGQNFGNNTYFGSQYNDWSNLRPLPWHLDSSQTFNRSQPPVNSGAYFSPNTYFGNANGQWSNINTGYAMPNYLGGYTYQP